MKNQFGKILSVLLLICAMINSIKDVSGWWLYLIASVIIALAAVGLDSKQDNQ